MLISTVIRARITPIDAFIGVLPGVCASTLGAMMARINIFKRQTAQLFKELDA